MKIICHRGFWKAGVEKNSSAAFSRALEHGFGIEIDLRDLNGSLVISHDPPIDGVMSAEEFIDLCLRLPSCAPMALNIKSDGIYSLVKDMVVRAGIANYFVFDMSVPDTRGYLAEHIPVYTRLSEYEQTPAFMDLCRGIWLDAFESEWYDEGAIKGLLDFNKEIAIVSSELHGRSHLNLWQLLKKNGFHRSPLISICTDLPLEAEEYFND